MAPHDGRPGAGLWGIRSGLDRSRAEIPSPTTVQVDDPAGIDLPFAHPHVQAHFVRGSPRPGRLIDQFRMLNSGGSMIVNVSQSATLRNYTYKVARATGSDTAFNGGSGALMITQASTFSAPFHVSGQATMTFTPG
jgi:hypothetical protein